MAGDTTAAGATAGPVGIMMRAEEEPLPAQRLMRQALVEAARRQLHSTSRSRFRATVPRRRGPKTQCEDQQRRLPMQNCATCIQAGLG